MFNDYPSIIYPLIDENNSISHYSIVDIMTRIKFAVSFTDFLKLTNDYTILDQETPEMISYKLYNTPHYHWTILFVNNIFDYVNDWVLSEDALYNACMRKYITESEMNKGKYLIDEFGIVLESRDGWYMDNNTWVAPSGNNGVNVLADFIQVHTSSEVGGPYNYNRYNTTTEIVSNYEWEKRLNESKREIKVLKPSIMPKFIEEFTAQLKKNKL